MATLVADGLRESQAEKERFHRAAVKQLQHRYLSIQTKLDRAYDDRLLGRVSEDLWLRRSREWEAELEAVRGETARLERASHNYAVTGSTILELAKTA